MNATQTLTRFQPFHLLPLWQQKQRTTQRCPLHKLTAEARAYCLPARLPLLEEEDQQASTYTKSGQEAMVKMTFTGSDSI